MIDRHVLITGGAGYIGSLLTSELLRQNHRVTVVDSLLFGGEAIVPFLHHPNFHFVKMDVTEPRAVKDALKSDWPKPDAVVHLAAIVGFPACQAVGRQVAWRYNVEAAKRTFEQAAELTDERALAELRREVADELDEAVRSADYRERAAAYRAIGPLRFKEKAELLRRGLEDESPACRGSALLSLELLSRQHPGAVNSVRPRLHTLANEDPNQAVRRLAVLCLRNGSPAKDTITLLGFLSESEHEERELRAAAASVRDALKRKAMSR